uniref:Tudor-knot domain-containing protein n=1 Tax=Haplochromis burtoni TaxID=8153 RepID=A0A3Q2VML0_HAPBU
MSLFLCGFPCITFEVGAKLEARDHHKNWYTATIEKIDYDKERVLIHYLQWSRRHDEWFQWNSPYLRPKERVSLRRQEGAELEGEAVNLLVDLHSLSHILCIQVAKIGLSLQTELRAQPCSFASKGAG